MTQSKHSKEEEKSTENEKFFRKEEEMRRICDIQGM